MMNLRLLFERLEEVESMEDLEDIRYEVEELRDMVLKLEDTIRELSLRVDKLIEECCGRWLNDRSDDNQS